MLDPRMLKEQAGQRLERLGTSPRKLVAIHIGVVILLSLVSNALTLVLEHWIGDTGGLGGLGVRSMLQTAQSVLQIVTLLFTPFWTAGFLGISLGWADGREPGNGELLSGFRRGGAVVSNLVFMMILLFGAGMVSGYVAYFVFSLMPQADALMALTELTMEAVMEVAMPMMLIYIAVLMILMVFIGYGVRLSTYFIMDRCRMGGFAAALASFRAMRGNKLRMLKLDLSFWWYYLLEAAAASVCYLDVILQLLGVTLPVDATVMFFATLIVYGVLELALQMWAKPKVNTTYALAYRAITAPEQKNEEMI